MRGVFVPRGCLDDCPEPGSLAVEAAIRTEPVETIESVPLRMPQLPAPDDRRDRELAFRRERLRIDDEPRLPLGGERRCRRAGPGGRGRARPASAQVRASVATSRCGLGGNLARSPSSSHQAVSSTRVRNPVASFQSRGSSSMSTPSGSSLLVERNVPGSQRSRRSAFARVVAAQQPHRAVAVPALERVRLLLGLAVRDPDPQHRRRAVRELDPDDVSEPPPTTYGSPSVRSHSSARSSTDMPLPYGAFRGVAQPGSALRSGRRGPQFESGHPDLGSAGGRSRPPARSLSRPRAGAARPRARGGCRTRPRAGDHCRRLLGERRREPADGRRSARRAAASPRARRSPQSRGLPRAARSTRAPSREATTGAGTRPTRGSSYTPAGSHCSPTPSVVGRDRGERRYRCAGRGVRHRCCCRARLRSAEAVPAGEALCEDSDEQRSREPYDVEEVAVDPLDERRAEPLDRIGAGAALPLAATRRSARGRAASASGR